MSLFWDARKTYLPAHLRLEDNPADVGVKPEKQNHYRQMVALEGRWFGSKWDFSGLSFQVPSKGSSLFM